MTVRKEWIPVLLIGLLVLPVNAGLAEPEVAEPEDAPEGERTVYRISPQGVSEAVVPAPGDRGSGYLCRRLFEGDTELQNLAGMLTDSLTTMGGNATVCMVNSTGRGAHLKIELRPWLLDFVVNQAVWFLQSVGLENYAHALLEIIGLLDIQNNTVGAVLRPRYWSSDGHTVIEPLLAPGEPIELTGPHRALFVGFVGYVSYNWFCRIGYAEYYGMALVATW